MMMSALIAAIGFSACAQKIDAAKVPAAVKAAFEKQYAGVAVKWEKEGSKFEAEVNGKDVIFDANGKYIETK